MTRMRSARVTISGMSLEMSSTETPSRGDLADQLVQIGLGLDVDADGRLVDDQDLGVRRQPLGDRDLLLVAAGEVADRLRRATACAPRAGGRKAATARVSAARRDQAERAGEPPPDGDRDVVPDRMHEDQPLLLAVLADVADAVAGQRLVHVADADRLRRGPGARRR